ncbi:MAG: methionine--tRNA ligase [Mycoplasma sp.]|nr:methionine--tRNA ligase [Mycoplasma sp.]
MKKFYITTPIYYPSGNLHIGHAYTTSLAEILVNYKKLMGFQTYFVTGSDEHGQKIEKKAKELNMEPKLYVDKAIENFYELWEKLEINYDHFVRTTDDYHIETVQNAFDILKENGLIYKGNYEGLYSVSDEEFFTTTQAEKDEEGNYYSPVSGHKLEVVNEETYFLKTSSLADWLKDYANKNKNFILPEKVLKELNANFLNDLEDLSVTRTTFTWGVPVRGDEKHVIYVWFDALLNYISSLGILNDKDDLPFWDENTEIVHLVGKEITRFHCIYWPMILKGLGVRQPNTIFGHGWIVTNTGKMSKSKGNVINPIELLKEYPAEVIKYFLTTQIRIGHDGTFSKELLETTYNAELVNTYGNLVSRTISMILQNFEKMPEYKNSNLEIDNELEKKLISKWESFITYMDNYKVDKGIKIAISLAKELNNYIDLTKPWTLKENKDRLAQVLHILLNGIYICSSILSVVMPKKMNNFLKIINYESFDITVINNFKKFENLTPNDKNKILFERWK